VEDDADHFIISGCFDTFVRSPGALSFDWNFNNTLAILTSAVLGFLLQWSGALALG